MKLTVNGEERFATRVGVALAGVLIGPAVLVGVLAVLLALVACVIAIPALVLIWALGRVE